VYNPYNISWNKSNVFFRNRNGSGESERQVISCNPDDASVYYDATVAIPQVANALENDSSGSHPIGDNPGNKKHTGLVNGNVMIMAQADGTENVETVGNIKEEPISPVESPNLVLSPVHTSLALGGCTPGLRRRREASDKYATSIAEVSLKTEFLMMLEI